MLIINEKEENFLFSVYDKLSVKFLTILRLEFDHLKEHKFWHGFKHTLNPLCTFGAKVETIEHFFLNCQLYSTYKSELFDNIVNVVQQLFNLTAKDQVFVLLYSSQRNNSENLNQNIISFVIKYLKSTARFDRFMFNNR